MTNAVIISTSLGDITVELNPEKAPVSVENFLHYVKEGFYTGTIFHRVIKGFMIQGGGLTEQMQRKDTTSTGIANESLNGLSNKKYTISMARSVKLDSATCQFFINTKDNLFLDPKNNRQPDGYAVFGEVIKGQDVVDQIEKVRTTRKGIHDDVPVTPIVIHSISVVETK